MNESKDCTALFWGLALCKLALCAEARKEDFRTAQKPPKLTAFCSKTGAAAFLLLGLWLEEEQLSQGGCSAMIWFLLLDPLVSSLQYICVVHLCVLCVCLVG